MSQDYFTTQRLISTFDPEFKPEILNHHLLIVGLGGNGSHIALAAARMGFKKITGIDKDLVSESNLSRQVLYTTEDLGKYKANAARKNLYCHNLISEIETHNFDILSERERFGNLVKKSDFIFIVLDQPAATFFAVDTCYHLQKPAVLGGTCTMSGLATRFCWMSPQQSPCLNCSFASSPYLERWFEFYKFHNGQRKIKTEEVSAIDKKISLEGGHPSIYPTACIGSNLMLSIALNYFMSHRDMPRMIEFSILNFTLQKSEIMKNKNCPTCSK